MIGIFTEKGKTKFTKALSIDVRGGLVVGQQYSVRLFEKYATVRASHPFNSPGEGEWVLLELSGNYAKFE